MKDRLTIGGRRSGAPAVEREGNEVFVMKGTAIGKTEGMGALFTRATCTRSKPGWVCLRDAGHEGPCAAAPTTGPWACPDIAECKRAGCQCRCGPGAQEPPPFAVQLGLDVADLYHGATPGFKLALVAGAVAALMFGCFVVGCAPR